MKDYNPANWGVGAVNASRSRGGNRRLCQGGVGVRPRQVTPSQTVYRPQAVIPWALLTGGDLCDLTSVKHPEPTDDSAKTPNDEPGGVPVQSQRIMDTPGAILLRPCMAEGRRNGQVIDPKKEE